MPFLKFVLRFQFHADQILVTMSAETEENDYNILVKTLMKIIRQN